MDRLNLILNKEVVLNNIKQINRRHVLIAGGALIGIWVAVKIKNWYSFKRYFKRMLIPGPEPSPILGNFSAMIKAGLPYYELNLAKEYGRIVGIFEGSVPVILTTDINFIRCMLIRDFNSFANRRIFDAFDVEPVNKFLSVLRDDEWKNVRSILSTSFTTGKIKSMSKCMEVCAKNFVAHFDELVEKDPKIDVRKAFGCYSLDVISSCCFGVDANSIKDQDSEFIRNMQLILANTLETNPAFLLIAFFPKLAGFLSKHNLLEFFPKKNFKLLSDFTLDVIEKRKRKELMPREDFIQNMIEHQENEEAQAKQSSSSSSSSISKSDGGKWNNSPLKKTLSNAEIISQAIIFLIAGFETTAINLGFIAYNLAKNPECQDHLCAEIDDVLSKHGGEANYDSISEMKYMEAVIDETLRMFPPAQRLEREVTSNIEYNDLKLKKGQTVIVPVYALHHDPDLYPEPDRFKPERFLKETAECKSRDAMAFLPFGAGPRGCLGMRFALIETKIILAAVLAKFRFVPCPETPEKITLDSSGFSRCMTPIYVTIEKR